MNQSDAQTSKRALTVSHIPGPDFTTYRTKQDVEAALPPDSLKEIAGKKKHSYPGSLIIEDSRPKSIECRSLACSAYKGRFWSITLRSSEDNTRSEQHSKYYDSVKTTLTKHVEDDGYDDVKLRDFLGYCPRGYAEYAEIIKPRRKTSSDGDKPPAEEIFLNEIYTLCHALYEILFPQLEKSPRPSGLIVITGATDSSKSLITRGLIFLFLQKAAEHARLTKQRKPHLVTFEDPIEQYYIKDPLTKTVPQTCEELERLLDALYIDFTPREKEIDAENLNQVLKDALRQTPAVLFVGETREKEDWKDLLQFAGSGHLVITTSHASSVVEAMSGIFRDTETKTPAQRSEIARRIAGVINIRSYTPKGTTIRALLPAIWNATSQSMNNLIADGLASIVPARGAEIEMGYYGRTYFADRLTSEDANGVSPIAEKMLSYASGKQAVGRDFVAEIKKKAIEWDLKGA